MAASAHGWRDELRDQARAFSGGLMFGIPLLYTMEVWWVGAHTSARQMALILAVTFASCAVLTHLAGFRDNPDVTMRETLMDAVEAVAMGLAVSALVLAVIQEISFGDPAAEVLGKVIYHAFTASIGVALAASFFKGASDSSGEDDAPPGESELMGTVVDLGASALGTVFVASTIATTDEIPMLAAVSTPGWLLVVIAASILASYCVVFVSGFAKQEQRRQQRGVLQHPFTETIAAYVVALFVCAALLVAFQRINLSESWQLWGPEILLLGLPGAVGGAAGRLAV